jgi:hypothetical protein
MGPPFDQGYDHGVCHTERKESGSFTSIEREWLPGTLSSRGRCRLLHLHPGARTIAGADRIGTYMVPPPAPLSEGRGNPGSLLT